MNRPALLYLLACVAAVPMPATHLRSSPQDAPDAAPPEQRPAPLAQVIKTLAVEARAARDTGAWPRQVADIANSMPLDATPVQIRRALLARANADPLIDAYIRWQLTSFQPALADLDDHDMQRLLRSLPTFAGNPRADDALVRDMQRLVQLGELPDSAQESLSRRLDELASRSATASSLNLPANRFRDWLASEFKSSIHRTLLLRLERIQAAQQAGWPIESLRDEVDRLMEANASNPALTADQRRTIIAAAGKLQDGARLAVVSADLAGGALQANFTLSAVYDFDVRRWRAALESGLDAAREPSTP